MLAALALIALPAVADEVARLHALFDKNWETRLRESPTFATSVGRHEYDDRLPSVTPADLAQDAWLGPKRLPTGGLLG